MKAFFLCLSLAIIACAVAGPFGRGGRKGPRPCRVVYDNGTTVTNTCPGNLIGCERIEDIQAHLDQVRERITEKLSRFLPDRVESIVSSVMARIEDKLANVRELSLCLPVSHLSSLIFFYASDLYELIQQNNYQGPIRDF